MSHIVIKLSLSNCNNNKIDYLACCIRAVELAITHWCWGETDTIPFSCFPKNCFQRPVLVAAELLDFQLNTLLTLKYWFGIIIINFLFVFISSWINQFTSIYTTNCHIWYLPFYVYQNILKIVIVFFIVKRDLLHWLLI